MKLPTLRSLLCAFCSFFVLSPLLFAAEKPNIIVMMSDDMGFSDIGCYGSEIDTPNLDALAANGLRFTQFYNTGRCCPTRASLLTGLYPHQAGIGHMMSDRGFDGYRGDLNKECVTIAEVLREAGYGTYISGKWHVTKEINPEGPKFNWPLQRGFDRFYGTIHGAGSFFDPNTLTRDNTYVTPVNDTEYQPEQYYYTDAISDHAVRFINEHCEQKKDDPFFVYVAYTAAHWPMHALEKDIAKYKGKYDSGYNALRRERFERMKDMGLIRRDAELSPDAEDWESYEHKEWDARNMEVYAAMIDNMDQGIGRIVEALKENGELDNTLILFMQDNGGCAENLGRKLRDGAVATRPDKPTLPPLDKDYLQPDMIPKQTRDGYPLMMGPEVMPGPDGTYIAYGRGWANASNTPFREYKHWVHEGGIATPLVAHWPAGIERKNELDKTPSHLIDIMATCVDLAGAEYPSEFNGEKIQPLEGKSLKPAFSGKEVERDALYWEHEGNRAVRVGNWKLVAKGAKGKWELYNIGRDRSEMHDMSAERANIAERLAKKWQAWAERARVLPLNPKPGQVVEVSKAEPEKNAPRKQRPKNPAMLPVEDVAGLPRVLLIGDSISIGYTVAVRDELDGEANVHRPLTNCGPTTKGVAEIDKWLGDGKWDVIHFNWGLHDLKYMGPNGENLADPGDPTSKRQVETDEYEKNLRILVDRLKKTGAKLIWRNTTPITEGTKGRIPGHELEYNAIAKKVMDEHGIPIHDLHAYALPKLIDIQIPANVHFTPEGSEVLAGDVANVIRKELK
ncbi:MAG: sulfatase-like hydrolase/transferase [Verrucomicrobiota bacterium]